MAEQSSPPSLHKVIFDTEVLICYLRGHEKARRFIEDIAHEWRMLSSSTLMELLQGCRSQQEGREVKALVSEPMSLVIYPEETISRRVIGFIRAARVFPRTSRRGRDYCGKRS